jgi:hypothetical protein
MKINRKIVALMVVFLLILQILGASLCLAEMDDNAASLTGRIYDRGVDTDHNGKFDYLEVSVEINVTDAGEYKVEINGLTDADGNYISVYDYTTAYLSTGTRLLNLSLYGPTIFVSGKNPKYVDHIGLLLFRDYQLFTKFFGYIDSEGKLNLTKVYNYNEFDAPFKDMEARLTIDPDGQVHLAGALNYTHMTPPNEMLGARGSTRIAKDGNLTSASTNCTLTVSPEIASEFPYNSTSFSWLEEYSNRQYSMEANATVTLPTGISSQFPFNATDLSLKSTYSNANGLLNTQINASMILPENLVPQYVLLELPLLNSTDFTIEGQYSDNSLTGTITFHILSGSPVGDLTINFQGNKTDLFLTGNVKVIYDIPVYPLNKTTLEQMLIYLNSTIPGHGSGSLYEMTNETLDCPYLNTKMTPYDSIGANVNFNASIHGDFIEALVYALSSYLSGYMDSPEMSELIYSALNATVSSVKSASFQIAYTYVSREFSIRLTLVDDLLNLVKDLSALLEEIQFDSSLGMMETTLMSTMLGSLMFLNSTLPYVENAEIELTYAKANKKLEIEATAQAEFPEDMTQTLPEEIPPELKELIESLQNTTYCKLKSSRSSIVYENGIANLKDDYVIEGDLNAQINFVKNVYFNYMNTTSILSEPLTFINETVIDVSNLEINFNYNETYAKGDLEGLTVLPPKDSINATFFQLKSLFRITDTPNESPVQRERLKITVEGGSNVTHAVILHQPETVPTPNETSPDMRTMVWYNQSVSNLKDLIFEIKPQSYGIIVTINDQSGNPIPNASVNVYWPNGTLWKTLPTGDNGSTPTFNVDYGCMPFGTYNITATYQEVSGTQYCTLDHTGKYTLSLQVGQAGVTPIWTQPWFIGIIIGTIILIAAAAAYVTFKKKTLQKTIKK